MKENEMPGQAGHDEEMMPARAGHNEVSGGNTFAATGLVDAFRSCRGTF